MTPLTKIQDELLAATAPQSSAPSVKLTSRLEIRMNDKLAQDIEELSKARGISKTDIVKRALTLYLLATGEKGGKLYYKDGERETELLVAV